MDEQILLCKVFFKYQVQGQIQIQNQVQNSNLNAKIGTLIGEIGKILIIIFFISFVQEIPYGMTKFV